MNVFDKVVINAKNRVRAAKEKAVDFLSQKHEGIDGIMVTVGLCIIALVILVTVKTELVTFVTTMVSNMTTKANAMLDGTL